MFPLDKTWTFRRGEGPDTKFWPVAQFPTNIHLDLLHNGLIPDPFIGKNETDVQWVGETQWVYRTKFFSPEIVRRKAVLAFDGLDTYATVMLNGYEILKTEDMFIPERVDVTRYLKSSGENVMQITFDSTFEIGKKIVKDNPMHQWGCWNGDPSRLAVRKAQYHYGWDWGPALLTCGPWRPINLELYTSRIADLCFSVEIDDSLKSAKVVAKAEIECEAVDLLFEIVFEGKVVGAETVRVENGIASACFLKENPALWYPAGYGKQPLYVLKATLLSGRERLDTASKRFGLRKAKVIQRKLDGAPGRTFLFEINNTPIFCGGSCWIPAETSIPKLNVQKYYEWVRMAIDSNQIMIRVWGGGIYEEQAFYDACDEMGVLVWQDFLFACGNYPAGKDFLNLVTREATANLKLLRHHPSIVLLAGNNEDYQYQEQSKNSDYDPSDHDPESWLKSSFPARYIYEKLLPDITRKLVPDIHYHFGSPFGGKSTTDQTVGDIHAWNVWHGTQAPYQEFDQLCGRFVAEFGMEAFPSIRTIDSYLPLGRNDPDRYAQSSTVDFHNKAAGGERRLATYMTENLPFTFKPFEQYIYATQLLQAEAVGTAYRLFRRQWKGPGQEYCAGALVWQLNDCWPVTSWSIVDYYLRPKLAYFAVKRELAPITVGIKQNLVIHSNSPHANAEDHIELWASNFTLEDRSVQLRVMQYDIFTGAALQSDSSVPPHDIITLPANRSTELLTLRSAYPNKKAAESFFYRTVTVASLFDSNNTQQRLARSISWPEPLKYIPFQKPRGLRLELVEEGSKVEIRSEVPVKGVVLEVEVEDESEGGEEEEVKWEDNGVDIVPGEPTVVGVKGLLKRSDVGRIRCRYLGSEGECGA